MIRFVVPAMLLTWSPTVTAVAQAVKPPGTLEVAITACAKDGAARYYWAACAALYARALRSIDAGQARPFLQTVPSPLHAGGRPCRHQRRASQQQCRRSEEAALSASSRPADGLEQVQLG